MSEESQSPGDVFAAALQRWRQALRGHRAEDESEELRDGPEPAPADRDPGES